MDLIQVCKLAKETSREVSNLSTDKKNNILNYCATLLLERADEILNANKIDLDEAIKNNLSSSFIDRLTLNHNRIKEMANCLKEVANLEDPIGQCEYVKSLPNGLKIAKRIVPMGVIAIIYEARPNVTADAFGLCLKAGSCVVLKGGKEALNSNKAIVKTLKDAIKLQGVSPNIIGLVESIEREITLKMLKLNEYIDLLIPRGSAGLIKTVVENSNVPIIETGTGNCHIFVDKYADIEKAIPVILNSKTQKTSACNSLEKVIIHKDISKDFLPILIDKLLSQNVEIRVDEKIYSIFNNNSLILASEEDWKTEYLDNIIALKIVDSIEDAINHISLYSTKHSDGIITESYENINKFVDNIDSAVVYVNSSTRFSDGNQFGFGAEIGISTQKMHARGPMGLKEITSYKYVVLGKGQIRE